MKIPYVQIRKNQVESFLNSKNWTGYTVKELARAGRIGNAEQTVKEATHHFSQQLFFADDLKGSVANTLAFQKLATIALQSIIDNSN